MFCPPIAVTIKRLSTSIQSQAQQGLFYSTKKNIESETAIASEYLLIPSLTRIQ